jgi:ribosomal protein S27AE
MDGVKIAGLYGPDVEVDLCFACSVIWFDKRESIHLSAGGTLRLFRVLHEHHEDPRNALGSRLGCPRCSDVLSLTHDIGKGGRFSYYACPDRHGRLTPFSEFLKEKQFVRILNPLEQQRLLADVKQVRCSSCGAPVDLANGFQCGHCGAPITVLDPDAVEKTLRELETADAQHSGDHTEQEMRARALAAMETLRTGPQDHLARVDVHRPSLGGELGVDLLRTSISLIFGKH